MSHRGAIWVAFLLSSVVALPSPASAQITELYFSEYIEGSSNNKALEIFNGTGMAVDLAAGGYNVQIFFNGSTSPGLTIHLTGTVAADGVFVLAQASASSAILAQADQTNGMGWYNGDDAVVLRKGTTVIDVIGQIGFDPGAEWGTEPTSTADNTLRRKLSIIAGDTDSADAFDPSVQWDGFANNTFDGLGVHTVAPPISTAQIWQIQGTGLTSPLEGFTRRTTGVVTAVTWDGFFIQGSDAGDPNPDQTSDGLFVFTSSTPAVVRGDEVEVTGTIVEFFNMTELSASNVAVTASGRPIPPPVTFDEHMPSPAQPYPTSDIERFEGMLVRVVDGLVSSPTNQFGEASVVVSGARPFREPGILFPGLPGLPVWDGNPEIFEIDTDRFADAPGLHIAAGARITAEGPLAFSFSDYQIWPIALEVTGAARIVPVRGRRPGEFTVGSQNLLRLFDTVDDPDVDDPPPSADRLTKLSLHVRKVLGSPDVLAVQEVENLTTLHAVATHIQQDDPSVVYTAYLLEGNDIGGIDVGFLVRDTVRVNTVEQFGKDDIFEFSGVAPAPLNDRPPLVLRGAYVADGADFPITVINVHQRSLGGIDDARDGARVRAKRHEQALRLSRFIDALQDAEPGLHLVVIGDFNAFEFTDGYVDVMGQVTGRPDPAGALLPATDEVIADLTNHTLNIAPEQRYSFVFDGTAQSLDHALTSLSLDPWVRGVQHSRGNADAPFGLANDGTTPLRTSDHDGTVLFLTSDIDSDGVPDNLDRCTDTRVPEDVPTIELKPNHYALLDGDGLFDTAAPRGRSTPKAFTIDDTAGCSCEQILDRLGERAIGERNFGCSVDTMSSWTAAQKSKPKSQIPNPKAPAFGS